MNPLRQWLILLGLLSIFVLDVFVVRALWRATEAEEQQRLEQVNK